MSPKASTPTRNVKIPFTEVRQRQVNGRLSYLEKEHPSPASFASNTSHMKDTIREKSTRDVGNTQCRPEEAKSNGQLKMLIEVR
jgi:hypothetical protein